MPSKPTGRPRGRPPGAKNIPKPTAKVEHTVKTAGDLLDEMAEE